MKNSILCAVMAITCFSAVTKVSAQANTSLSNLLSPTKVNVGLIPYTSGTLDLGTTSLGWRNMCATGYFYLDGSVFISNPGTENNFIGTNAGKSTTGSYNFAAGTSALYSNTTGSSNTAVGAEALYFNINGAYNTALGNLSLNHNSSGNYNTAIGMQTLYSNQGGSYNTANGYFAPGYNTSGTYNTSNGFFSLLSNTTGNYNTANGSYALYQNQTGISNVANGAYALNTSTSGNYNTATGTASLERCTTGSYNTFTGMNAGYYGTTGYYNTGVGYSALLATTAANYNTAVGYNAGYSQDNGYNNVFLGANTDVNGAGYYNVIAIGQGVVCTNVSQARIGNSATSSIGGWANWTNISDGRVKKNIQQNVPGLNFINKLQPVTYNLDLAAADKIIQAPVHKDAEGKVIEKSTEETAARAAKEQVVYSGFIAQDVEKAAKDLGYNFSGVDAAKNSKDLYGLRYAEFVVPLVKAVQELSKLNEDKDTKIDDLQKQINELRAMITGKTITPVYNDNQLPGAALLQNTPNPFTNTTSIGYRLPQLYASAKIVVTDIHGALLKQYSLNSGNGNVQVDAATLASGAYSYTLYVNGKRVDTKQMISAK